MSMEQQAVLAVKGLCKSFGGNEVLKEIRFEIEPGEFVAVMGHSGCGKSTLLYCASGMDEADAGEIRFQGKMLQELSDQEKGNLRLNRMGFVFQKASFLKNLSVRDNILFPALEAGSRARTAVTAEVEKLMREMGIAETAAQDIRTVSGGQLQRAAICRAVINHPDILFGDEPTGALNSAATREVLDIFERLNREGMAIFMVTHDAKVAARADRVIYLEDGRIKAELKQGTCQSRKEQERQSRERRLTEWLVERGF